MAAMSYAEKARLSNYEITEDGKLVVYNAWMLYRNFAGDPAKNYKPSDTSRNFSLLLDEPIAKRLMELGWNVQTKDAKTEDDEPYYVTKVTINPNSKFPPKIFLFTALDGVMAKTEMEIEDYYKIDNGEIRIKSADLAVSLAKAGGRYLQELKIYERPQKSGWLRDRNYEEAMGNERPEEIPFE